MSVEPTYLETRSSPDSSQYFWAYRVVIENHGRETVHLLSWHWMITNARGELTEVKGPGVVGEQPVLKPGESFEYASSASLNTPSGMMGGAYQMEGESGERFDIEIPTFSLDRPNLGVIAELRNNTVRAVRGPEMARQYAIGNLYLPSQ